MNKSTILTVCLSIAVGYILATSLTQLPPASHRYRNRSDRKGKCGDISLWGGSRE